MKWDVHALCQTTSVNRKLCALVKRLLWKDMCIYRAPRMISSLMDGTPNGRTGGEWDALAKLLFFCCGCNSTRHFQMDQPYLGHFVKSSRFSKTSGRSFLVKRCRTDLLGVFEGFTNSKTRACLIRRQLEVEEGVRCPFYGGRVWSKTAARLVPRSATRRLGKLENELEYFVCVNGHLHGSSWLVPLSSDEDANKDTNDDKEEDDDGEDDDANQIGSNGSVSDQSDGPTS
ncbi:hypothetical protein HAX54_022567 [Datura stramonium]|uniref:Uncharacterized protein n=1 Tax=Datura stramonium TaxID=4076 RepID=A0ABS8UUT0_DATST|nr:hypothetical protein [Datura stramonium]